MTTINKYKKDVELYYKKFTDGGFGKSKLTFYNGEKIDTLPEELKNSSLACGNPLRYLQDSPPPDNCKFFDLGCGGGFELALINKSFSPSLTVGLDYSEGMIDKCKDNIIKYCDENTFCLRGDGETLPFEDGTFDVCVSNAAINLIPNKDKVFSEVKRILKPNGRFVFSDVTILTPLPPKIRECFTVMEGLCFAPTIIDWEEELDLVKKYFDDVSIVDEINIVSEESHTEFLISKIENLSKKDRKFYKRAIMKSKYKVIEVEAFVNAKSNIDEIECNCGKKTATPTFQIIDIEKSPRLFSRFVNKEINVFKCDHCEIISPLPVPVMILWEKINLKATIFPEFLKPREEMLKNQLPSDEKMYFSSESLLNDFPLLKKII